MIARSLGVRAKRDDRELRHQPATVVISACVAPAKQAAQDSTDDRGEEPVAPLVSLDHQGGLVRRQDPIDGDEMLSPDVDFRFRRCLDIAKPVGARAEAAHDNQFRTVGTIFQHFQDGFALPSGAVADMG